MTIAAIVFACLASVLHVYIFALESLRWTDEGTRRTFGTSLEQAQQTREMAYNQGFYNLFLAIVTVVGVVLVSLGSGGAGPALIFAGCGSMVAAGLVLLVSSPGKTRAALTQLTLPLVAVVLLAVALAL